MKTLHFQDANIARAQDLEDAKSRLESLEMGWNAHVPQKKGPQSTISRTIVEKIVALGVSEYRVSQV